MVSCGPIRLAYHEYENYNAVASAKYNTDVFDVEEGLNEVFFNRGESYKHYVKLYLTYFYKEKSNK